MPNAILSELDLDIHGMFADVGMADVATLRVDSGESFPCNVYVDLEPIAAQMGGTTFNSTQVVVRILRAPGLPTPRATNTITCGSSIYTVDKMLDAGESIWSVLCRR